MWAILFGNELVMMALFFSCAGSCAEESPTRSTITGFSMLSAAIF